MMLLINRTMANYMLSRVVLQSLVTGNRMMREMERNLDEQLFGVTETPSRWRFCLNQLTGSLSIAMSSLYIKHHLNDKSRHEVSNKMKLEWKIVIVIITLTVTPTRCRRWLI